MIPNPAIFTVRAFSHDGSSFRRAYGADDILSVPSIVRAANQPAGELEISLALQHDASGFGTDLNHFDRWDVYATPSAFAVDGTQRLGAPQLVYRGHVEEITLASDGGSDSVSVRLFPTEAALGRSLWKHGGSYAFGFSAASVESMLAALLADLNAAYPSVDPAVRFPSALTGTGVTGSLSFDHVTHQAALETIGALLPAEYSWRFEADGTFTLDV